MVLAALALGLALLFSLPAAAQWQRVSGQALADEAARFASSNTSEDVSYAVAAGTIVDLANVTFRRGFSGGSSATKGTLLLSGLGSTSPNSENLSVLDARQRVGLVPTLTRGNINASDMALVNLCITSFTVSSWAGGGARAGLLTAIRTLGATLTQACAALLNRCWASR